MHSDLKIYLLKQFPNAGFHNTQVDVTFFIEGAQLGTELKKESLEQLKEELLKQRVLTIRISRKKIEIGKTKETELLIG